MFDEEFISRLSDNPIEAAKNICFEFMKNHGNSWKHNISKYDEYIKSYSLLSAYLEENQLKYALPELGKDRNENIALIINAIGKLQLDLDKIITDDVVEQLKNQFRTKFKNVFAYEFTEGDIDRIQQLLNELRKLISENKGFEEKYRRRLLKRLEKLQSELHKRVSDLDTFWGLIGDAGVVIGKFGDDAKPFVDRIKEIADIIWRTQSRAEELPTGTKLPLLTQEVSDS